MMPARANVPLSGGNNLSHNMPDIRLVIRLNRLSESWPMNSCARGAVAVCNASCVSSSSAEASALKGKAKLFDRTIVPSYFVLRLWLLHQVVHALRERSLRSWEGARCLRY